MVEGHAIYVRSNPETGVQYAGKVWWTNKSQTPEKAVARRQKDHEKNGMAGWEYEIVSTEKREDAPSMSDGLYHIRIAVNEYAEYNKIPPEKRRNKQSPLLQLDRVSSSEDLARIGGRNQPREAKVAGGRNGSRNQPREAKAAAGRIGGRNQPREAKAAAGRNGSREAKAAGSRIGNCKRWNINRGKPCVCGVHHAEK